ncbi:MFS transporter [Cellulomonas carbonis]|uniref:MFS transporter n=1 Tax=Cellulomonas carbonis TaxID=1386092 RepID=UPI0005BDA0C7|nr:MFS transporter [Cellulomonas carbonis]
MTSVAPVSAAVRPPFSRATARRRTALFTVMLAVGIGTASWVVRTPAVRDLLQASTAQMGLILFGLSVGSMTGVLSSASVVRRHGARLTIAVGAFTFAAGVGVVGVSAQLSWAPGAFAGLALVGLGIGLCEIAINVEGAAIEIASGRSVLPMLHGCFSLGTVLGAVAGIGLNAISFPVVWHLAGVAAAGAAAMAWAIPSVSADTGRAAQGSTNGPGWRAQLAQWRHRRIAFLGAIVLALALAEGSASDWLPLLMVDGHGVSATAGSVVFAGFAAAMTVGRFAGEPLLARFGNAAVLRASALVSAAGIAVVVFSDSAVLAGFAVALWGLGAALGFPVTLSAAADSDDPTTSVAAVAVAGYLAFLVGPPLLGFLGEHVGLRGAMLVVLVVVAAASLLTSAAQPRAAVDRVAAA